MATAINSTQNGVKGIQSGNQWTNSAFASPTLIAAANSGGQVPTSSGGTTRVGGVSVTPGVPSANGTAYDPATAATANASIQPKINTAQPSPLTAGITPPAATPINPQQQATDYLKSLGYNNPDQKEIQGAMDELASNNPKTALTSLGDRAKVGMSNLKGTPVADNQGAAQSLINSSVPALSQNQPQFLGGIMETDSNFDSIFTALDKYMEPQSQKKSLVDEYKSLSDSLGISGLNSELVNAKRIIEGTESDVRLEIEKVGGFGTESQVLALSNARNKSLMKNYNVLLETRDNAMQQLGTMMNLTIEDRKASEAEFDRKMGYAFKIAEYRDKAIDNAKEGYGNIVKAVGYEGLYKTLEKDPHALSLAERTLGLSSGGLQKLASIPNNADTQVVKLDNGKTILINSKTGETVKNLGGQKSTSGGGVGGKLSPTAQAVADNPSLLGSLTSTVKGQVITELSSAGYDTSALGDKPLSDTAIKEINQSTTALTSLNDLKETVNSNLDYIGPISGFSALNPWSKARQVQAEVDRVKQQVGKALEGGVLRKEDEDKYKKILATINDTPETALSKIDNIIESITKSVSDYKTLQTGAGRSANVSGSLPKKSDKTTSSSGTTKGGNSYTITQE